MLSRTHATSGCAAVAVARSLIRRPRALKHEESARELGKLSCEDYLGRVGGDLLSSVAKLTSPPKPHANTVAPSPLTSAAASTAVSVPTIHSEIIAKRHKTTQIDEHSGTFS